MQAVCARSNEEVLRELRQIALSSPSRMVAQDLNVVLGGGSWMSFKDPDNGKTWAPKGVGPKGRVKAGQYTHNEVDLPNAHAGL